MAMKRGGLGRNLSALLSAAQASTSSQDAAAVEHAVLSVKQIQAGKYQPRGEMDEAALVELAESIKKQGLLQPIVVRALTEDHYEIIAGERRWRACQLAEMTQVPVIIKQVDDQMAMAMALVENLQREDLNAMDQARAMHRLTAEFALTHQEVAALVCKSRTAVSNYLRLLQLGKEARQLLENGDLDMGHARCLLVLDESQQNHIAQLIVAKELSVRETEALVARMKAGVSPQGKGPSSAVVTPFVQDRLELLAKQLQTKVNIKQGAADKGTLVIHYSGVHKLEKLVAALTESTLCLND